MLTKTSFQYFRLRLRSGAIPDVVQTMHHEENRIKNIRLRKLRHKEEEGLSSENTNMHCKCCSKARADALKGCFKAITKTLTVCSKANVPNFPNELFPLE